MIPEKVTCPNCSHSFEVTFPPSLGGGVVVEGGSLIICPKCGHRFSIKQDFSSREYLNSGSSKSVYYDFALFVAVLVVAILVLKFVI